jgi:hypothetical protein
MKKNQTLVACTCQGFKMNLHCPVHGNRKPVTVLGHQVELVGAEQVEVLIVPEGKEHKVWVNVDGICRLRIAFVREVKLFDKRKKEAR